jgi:hypothetical protein
MYVMVALKTMCAHNSSSKKRLALLLAVLPLLAACKWRAVSEQRLLGEWCAVKFVKNGEDDPRKLDGICLSFSENGRYLFYSFQGVVQEGRFHTVEKKLYFKPKGHAKKFYVGVEQLTQDTLVLEMFDGASLVATFVKQPANAASGRAASTRDSLDKKQQ